MNYYFFRNVTSSILASLFSFSLGISHVESANAEDTQRLTFCKQHKSLFHLNEGAERKVRIAVFDVDIISPTNITDQFSQEKYVFRGVGKILANELAKENNFRIINWNQISPKSHQPQKFTNYPIPQNSISLEKLRNLRHKYGVEAVLIGTINYFQANGERGKNFLGFGNNQKNNEVQVNLNFSVVDTNTGEVVIPSEGKGRASKTYTNITVPSINVNISNNLERNLDINNDIWTSRTRGSTIEFTLNSNDDPQTLISSGSDNILQKLLALAVEDSIKQIVAQLNTRSDELACLVRKPTLIADTYFDIKYGKDIVILNKGRLYGYCEGMIFSIERPSYPVVDPATGRIIRVMTNKVGKVQLFEVDAQSSVAIGIQGASFRGKDVAKLLPDKKCGDTDESQSDSTKAAQ